MCFLGEPENFGRADYFDLLLFEGRIGGIYGTNLIRLENEREFL